MKTPSFLRTLLMVAAGFASGATARAQFSAQSFVSTPPTSQAQPAVLNVGQSYANALSFTVTFNQQGTSISTIEIRGPIPPGLQTGGTQSGDTNTVQSRPTVTFFGTPTAAGDYHLVVNAIASTGTNSISQGAVWDIYFRIAATATAPAITTQPASQTVAPGTTVTFTAAASGSPAPTLQWRKDGVDIAGASTGTLILTAVTGANAGNYTLVATNSAGVAVSNPASLTVTSGVVPPTINNQPLSVNVVAGQRVALNVSASGSGLSYQWRGAAHGVVVGATNPTLVFSSISPGDADNYTCVITNSAGSVSSNPAGVIVVASSSNNGFLKALSLRGGVGSGSDAFFVGFVLTGTGSNVLIKANGPGLGVAPFNVPGVLADPFLELFDGNGISLGTNDNWGGTPALVAANAAAGAFPLNDPQSKDAAILRTLSAGVYTAKATGVNNTTGVALVEIYSIATPANLGALSLRGNIGAGANAFFTGFVVNGSTAKTVLIKVVGAGLGAPPFNVPGVLADPVLELFDSNGVSLGGNDNWGGTADLIAANNAAGAFPLNDPNSKDAVMLISLPPGVYTAKGSGANNTTGVALIEIYGL